MAVVNMVFEFGLDEGFAHRVATSNMIGEVVLAVGPLAAGLVADRVGYAGVFLVALGFMATAQAVMVGWLRVPREGR